MGKGKVFLVGAGPGDSRLLTIKGLDCIKKAEVILYDRLVNPILLEEAKTDAELIYCGKLPDRHFLRQEAINELLVQKGKEGKIVVRLKGGDPSVFGRVGEEAEALQEHGIDFEIVPGITAGIAASSYAGIPVTHRDYGASFAIVTGHDKSVEGKPTIDWHSLAHGIDTIAFYMGVGNISHISEQLINHGRDPKTPVILIQWGTYSRQRTLEGTLSDIATKVQTEKFQNPAITLVGNIVALRDKLKWFEQRPFFNKSILLAKATAQPSMIAQEVRELGGEVFEFPRFASRELFTSVEKNTFLEAIYSAKNMYFTSPEAVDYFFQALAHFEVDIRQVTADFYAGSVKSQRAFKQHGCIAKLEEELKNDGSLLVLGEQPTDSMLLKLRERFGLFSYVVVHEQTFVEHSLVTLLRLQEEQTINTIVLPSAASAEKLYHAIKITFNNPNEFFQQKQIIAFGEKTKDQAVRLGITVDVTLEKPTVAHLLDSLKNKEVLG